MAGLGVLLETTAALRQQQQQHASPTRTAQIVSNTALLNTSYATAKNGYSSSSSSSSRAPMAAAAKTSSFLQRCFLCHRELADGNDIYIYRGDRAFCSDECRRSHILTEEDGAMHCAKDAVVPRGRSRRRQAFAGGFAY